MKFEIKNEKLTNAINKVQNGINNRNVIPALNGIKIECRDNCVSFISSRQDLSIKMNITEGINIIEEGEGVIPAKFLTAIVKNQDGQYSIIDVNEDKGLAKIESKNSKMEVLTYNVNTYPGIEFHHNNKVPITLQTTTFNKIYKATKHSAAMVKDHQSLMGINFKFENGKLSASSTDARRLSIYNVNLELNYSDNFTINKELCKIINTLIDENKELKIYNLDDSLLFELEGLYIKTAIIKEDYPDLNKLIPQNINFSFNVNKFQIIPILEKIEELNKNSLSPSIQIEFNNEIGYIKAEFPDFGNITESFIPSNVNGKAISFGVDPKYLLQALNALEDEAIIVNVKDELSPILIENIERKDNKQVISPIHKA